MPDPIVSADVWRNEKEELDEPNVIVTAAHLSFDGEPVLSTKDQQSKSLSEARDFA